MFKRIFSHKLRYAQAISMGLLLNACSTPVTNNNDANSQQLPQAQAQAQAIERTLYKGVNIIDGTGAALQKNMAILIEGDSIKTIFKAGQTFPDDKDIKQVDSQGWYALPGLIDTHVHMATLPNDKTAQALLRRQIYSGVTSVRDMAGDGRALANLARRTRLQQIPAPDLYYSALMAGPSFFSDPRPGMSAQGEIPGHVPWMQAIDKDSNIQEAVSLAKGSWASGIKIYANLEASTVADISAEARKQGIKTWAHSMVFPAFPHEVVAANVDAISHVCRLAFEISKEKPTQYHHKVVPDYANLDASHPKIVSIFDSMAEKGIQLDATVWLYAELARMRQESPKAKTIPVKCPVDFAAKLTQIAFERGVDISTGTDGMTPAKDGFPALYQELKTLSEKTQLSNLQIIRSATLVGAKVLGLDDQIGTISEGKKANLFFTQANPLEDLNNLHTILVTLKSGTSYPRKDFTPLQKSDLSPGS